MSLYGLKLGIRANRSELIAPLLAHMPPGATEISATQVDRICSVVKIEGGPVEGAEDSYILWSDNALITATRDFAEIELNFDREAELYVAEFAKRRVFIHAGVVGWKGRAILVPGHSYSGKTTLVAALVKAGATYYSDDFAVIDMQGRVHPYPKPLSIREQPLSLPTRRPVEELGGKQGVKPLPVGLVLVGAYREGAKWRPRRLTAGEGALELLANTVSAQTQPEVVLPLLRQIVAHAPVYKGTRGNAAEIASKALQMAGGTRD